jgi:hypothetical protein
MRLMILAVGPALLSRLSNAQAVLRDTPSTLACLAVVSKPPATKAARICASFEAYLAFARRFLMPCCIGHPAHKFVSLLALGGVGDLRYSSLGALPRLWSFGYVSLKYVTNALRQLGIGQHALRGVGI